MTKRSGSENRRRNIVVTIRVDETEKKLIERAATTQGVSVPELLRSSVFHGISASENLPPLK